jgi:hypothetical protein
VSDDFGGWCFFAKIPAELPVIISLLSLTFGSLQASGKAERTIKRSLTAKK